MAHAVAPPRWGVDNDRGKGKGRAVDECPISERVLSENDVRALASLLVAREDVRDVARRAFAVYDGNGKGYVDADDLLWVSNFIRNPIDRPTAENMIDTFALSMENGITKEEFVAIMVGPSRK
jgi:Ca2+-binding EF-hand superfamily protein